MVQPSFTTMSFRVVWHGRFGEESSQLIDDLERARLIADWLASRKKTVVYVVDVEANKTVYSVSHRPAERSTGSRSVSRPSGPSSSG